MYFADGFNRDGNMFFGISLRHNDGREGVANTQSVLSDSQIHNGFDGDEGSLSDSIARPLAIIASRTLLASMVL